MRRRPAAVIELVPDRSGVRDGRSEPPRRRQVALLLEDSVATRRLIVQMLQPEHLFDVFLEAENGQEALRLASEHTVDMVLCDLDLPDLDGFAFLDRFRRDLRNETIPVVALSGRVALRRKVEGLRRGANDYLVKPCSRDELCARVRNHLRTKLLQDELTRRNQELEAINVELTRSATTDPLTGLLNRRHFMRRAHEEVRRAQRYERCFGVIMLDIDHFKRVNDSLGHLAGDEVLVTVSSVLRASLRDTDLLARFGGEEFILGLPETGPTGAAVVAERVRSLIAAAPMPRLSETITVSVGASALPTTGVESIEQLIQLADAALYRAKSEGRNRAVIHGVG
jgi:diguanylate cyclase (GGDEF)-like protein